MGDQGPTKVLEDTGRWLEHFDDRTRRWSSTTAAWSSCSTDEELQEDTSAADVNAIVTRWNARTSRRSPPASRRLRDFWGDLAVRERFN